MKYTPEITTGDARGRFWRLFVSVPATVTLNGPATRLSPVLGSPSLSLSCQIPYLAVDPFAGPEPGKAGVPQAVLIESTTVDCPTSPWRCIQRTSVPVGEAKPKAFSEEPSSSTSHGP